MSKSRRGLKDGDHFVPTTISRDADGGRAEGVVYGEDGTVGTAAVRFSSDPAEKGVGSLTLCPGARQDDRIAFHVHTETRRGPPLANSPAYCAGWLRIFKERAN